MNTSSLFRMIKFGIVGVSGVVVNSGVLWALSFSGLPLEIRSPLAILSAITSNYLLNYHWTWNSFKAVDRLHFLASYGKYCLSSGATSLLLNYLPLLYLVSQGWTEGVANLIGIVCAAGVNYTISHYWTFKEKQQPRLWAVIHDDKLAFYLSKDSHYYEITKANATLCDTLPASATPIHESLLKALPEEIRQGEGGTIALKIKSHYITLFDQLEGEGEMLEGSAVYLATDEEFLQWWNAARLFVLPE